MDVFAVIVSIIGGVFAILFGLATFFRNKHSDDVGEGKKGGVVLTELGYIKSGVDDIKRKQEKQDEQHIEVISRLTAVESSAKQASFWQQPTVRIPWILHCFVRDVLTGESRWNCRICREGKKS